MTVALFELVQRPQHEGADRVHLRGRALDAARGLFIEDGYDGLSVAAVAERLDVPVASLSALFADRMALLAAVVDRDIDELVRELSAELDATSPLDALVHQAVAVFVDFARERRREYMLLFGQAGRVHPQVGALLQGLRARLATFYIPLFRAAAERAGLPQPPDAQARLIAYAVMGLCEGVVQAWLEDPPSATHDEIVALLSGLVYRALQP